MTVSMVQMMICGVIIPINNSTGAMAVVSRALPTTYCVDFARGVLARAGGGGIGNIPTLYAPGIDLIIIVAYTVVFFVLGRSSLCVVKRTSKMRRRITGGEILEEKAVWILCPICANKTRIRIREDTVLENFPLYCPKCKHETLISIKQLNMSVIKEPDAKTQSR